MYLFSKNGQQGRKEYPMAQRQKKYMPATQNLEEIDQFLEIYNIAKMKKEEIRNLNTQITSREIESAIKNLPTGDAYINRIEWKAETRYKPVTRWSIN